MTQPEAMLLSIALETPVALLAVATIQRARAPAGRRLRDAVPRLAWVALAAVVGTCITHPIVWRLNNTLTGWSTWSRLSTMECGAVVVEAATYVFVGRLPWRTAFVVSALANGFSFGVGLLIFWAQGR